MRVPVAGDSLPVFNVSGGPARGLRGGPEVWPSVSSGIKLDRTRIGGLRAGSFKSMPLAVAGRTGGGGPEDIAVDLLGDAV